MPVRRGFFFAPAINKKCRAVKFSTLSSFGFFFLLGVAYANDFDVFGGGVSCLFPPLWRTVCQNEANGVKFKSRLICFTFVR